MRYLIPILLLLASCSVPADQCLPARDTIYIAPPAHTCVRDTVYLQETEVFFDTVYYFNMIKGTGCDSLQRRLNTERLKYNRIKYYLDLCNRNPNQSVFLRGWLNRVVE